MVLICQECKGYGGYRETVLDTGEGVWVRCGWCDGLGEITPALRGIWLSYKKKEKHGLH